MITIDNKKYAMTLWCSKCKSKDFILKQAFNPLNLFKEIECNNCGRKIILEITDKAFNNYKVKETKKEKVKRWLNAVHRKFSERVIRL